MVTEARRNHYSRLLRWYPRDWRDENGAVVLDSLEQHADDRGLARPSGAEAWSLRAHGLGARATPRWAGVFAAIALVSYAASTAVLLTDAILLPGAGLAHLVLSGGIGALALSLSTLVLVHRRGSISSPAAGIVAACAIPACGFAVLTAASWSAGFADADAGTESGLFASAGGYFFAAAVVAGTACLAPLVDALIGIRRSLGARVGLSVVCAMPAAMVIGVLSVTGYMLGAIAAAVLLIMALRAEHRESRVAAPVAESADSRRLVDDGPGPVPGPRTAVRVSALVSPVLGLACAVFALTGSDWSIGVADATRAMNLGLAAGALAAIPVVLASAAVLERRLGVIVHGSALLVSVSLIVEAGAQFLGAGHPSQWPLTLTAALVLGLGLALPVVRLVPGAPLRRASIVVGAGVAASVIGLALVPMAGFIAPLAAVALLVHVHRAASAGRMPGRRRVEDRAHAA
ncbi:hypothetical protein [Planctomonas psychrotolerans]|uniref:hypothetical protein n=1 Tax=Planctomonas psychrotolerans TaxID=2528712 RepID=UPI001D0D459F|nr:hypothetical protein [Planctomonas psychrotolerans]